MNLNLNWELTDGVVEDESFTASDALARFERQNQTGTGENQRRQIQIGAAVQDVDILLLLLLLLLLYVALLLLVMGRDGQDGEPSVAAARPCGATVDSILLQIES